jgi:hypothetical protein
VWHWLLQQVRRERPSPHRWGRSSPYDGGLNGRVVFD